jgi:Domain of unknown function (DUF4336)
VACLKPYPPLNTLKPLAPDAWIVDGPIIKMRYPVLGFGLPFSTRMTVLRLPDGGLWVHSPTALTADLRAEIASLGPVKHLVAPNRIHYWWLGDWKAAFPNARSYAAHRVAETARKAGRFSDYDETLGESLPAGWADALDQVSVPGDYLTEIDFLHKPSGTLILTDLIENFEKSHVCWPLWPVMRWSGAGDPDGAMPLDLRSTFRRHFPAFRAAVERMIAWTPQRIVLAHGRWYPENAQGELKRAFRWLL